MKYDISAEKGLRTVEADDFVILDKVIKLQKNDVIVAILPIDQLYWVVKSEE
ncbi:MAG: hypothetical protein PHE56_15200 [Bacteroidales bacterium]|nr:hypothetical protein [Bacteroidales bacterium]